MTDLCAVRFDVSQIRSVESLDEVRNSVDDVGFHVPDVKSATCPLGNLKVIRNDNGMGEEDLLCVTHIANIRISLVERHAGRKESA